MGKNSTKQGRKDTAAEIFNSIEAWREQAAVSNSPHTVEAYRNAMDLYIRFLDQNQGITTKDFTWECFSREKIEKWMIWLTERGNKPQTVRSALGTLRSSKNLRLSHIREFLAYMEGRSAAAYGHLYHEAARIKRMKTQHAEVKGVPDAAVEAVMKAIDTSTEAGARDFVLLRYPPRDTR